MLIKMNSELQTNQLQELSDIIMPIFGDEEEAREFKQHLEQRFDEILALFSTTDLASKRLQELSMALRNRARIDARAEPVSINDVVMESLTISMGKLKPYDLKHCFDEEAAKYTSACLPNLRT